MRGGELGRALRFMRKTEGGLVAVSDSRVVSRAAHLLEDPVVDLTFITALLVRCPQLALQYVDLMH